MHEHAKALGIADNTPSNRTNGATIRYGIVYQLDLNYFSKAMTLLAVDASQYPERHAHLRELLRQMLVLRWRQFPHLNQ